MRRYAKLSTLDLTHFQEILKFFFDRCDKVNIYFPNASQGAPSQEITSFKNKFLAATHIIEESEELASLEETLEEKEGFTMVIASLTSEVKELLLEMKPQFHLSLGLISGEKVLFYLGDEDECVIEANENSEIFNSSLFESFQII
ncbi:MAG: hypothetical protein E7231_13270 [Cellulosilyticum sp.]|nr:hypothetical protein [Cellulosilyticum sp.]